MPCIYSLNGLVTVHLIKKEKMFTVAGSKEFMEIVQHIYRVVVSEVLSLVVYPVSIDKLKKEDTRRNSKNLKNCQII